MVRALESGSLPTVEQRIEQVYELPPMPELGQRILTLQSDPNAGAAELARIVQLDPSLAAQVIRYASSSYYGYTGRITNIQDAIARVLGYDMVLNLALGLAAGRSFRIPDGGPLGLSRFWEHSVSSAVLVQKIGLTLPASRRPASGLSYLCGLLHDFGILLLGHLFPPEFQLLNKMLKADPTQSVSELECRLLGMGQAREVLAMGHARIGAWLMETWRMPEALGVTLLEHHNPDYRGEHEILVHLVQLAEFVLHNRADLPDACALPDENLAVLQVAPERVFEAADSVLEAEKALSALSAMLVRAS